MSSENLTNKNISDELPAMGDSGDLVNNEINIENLEGHLQMNSNSANELSRLQDICVGFCMKNHNLDLLNSDDVKSIESFKNASPLERSNTETILKASKAINNFIDINKKLEARLATRLNAGKQDTRDDQSFFNSMFMS